MDPISYGAIKNLNKKLGLSMGEAGDSFAILKHGVLTSFDGFDQINQLRGAKSINTKNSINIGEGSYDLYFLEYNELDDHFYAISKAYKAFVKINRETGLVTTIHSISNSELLKIDQFSTYASTYGGWEYNSDFSKIIIIGRSNNSAIIKMFDSITGTFIYEVIVSSLNSFTIGSTNALKCDVWEWCDFNWATNEMYFFAADDSNYNDFGIFKVNISVDGTKIDVGGKHFAATDDMTFGQGNCKHCCYDFVNNKAYVVYLNKTNNIFNLYELNLTTGIFTEYPFTISNGDIELSSSNVYPCIYPKVIDGYIYMEIASNKIKLDTIDTTFNDRTYLLRYNTTNANGIFEIYCTTSMASSSSYTSYYCFPQYCCFGNNWLIKMQGNKMFYQRPTVANSYYVCWAIDLTTGKTTSHSAAFMPDGRYIARLISWDENTDALHAISISALKRPDNYHLSYYEGYYKYTFYCVDTSMETLAVIEASGGTYLNLIVDGITLQKNIGLNDNDKMMAVHAKNGLKIEATSSTSILDITWGVKTNV